MALLKRSSWLILLVIFCIYITIAQCEPCPNDCTSSIQGVCNSDDGTCLCNKYYEGEDCSKKWKDEYSGWETYLYVYSMVAVVTNVSGLSWAAVQLYFIFKFSHKNGASPWSIVTFTLIPLALGCTVRILQFLIDPHQIREIFSTVIDSVMFDLPMLLWFTGAFLLMLWWIEIQSMSGIKELRNISGRTRPVWIGGLIVMSLIIFPLGILKAFFASFTVFYNLAVALIILCFVGISSFFGIRLIRLVKTLYSSTKSNHYKEFIQKITYFILMANFGLISIIITLIVFLFVASNPWLYLTAHLLLRIEEIGVVLSLLRMVSKKKPDTDPNSTYNTAGSKGEDSKADYSRSMQMPGEESSADFSVEITTQDTGHSVPE